MYCFTDNNVLFLLLNGESYDYIGSSRVVWDMQHGVFPMKPSSSELQEPPPLSLQNIALFIELGQISTLGNVSGNSTTTLYFHQHLPTSNNVLNRNQVSWLTFYLLNLLKTEFTVLVLCKRFISWIPADYIYDNTILDTNFYYSHYHLFIRQKEILHHKQTFLYLHLQYINFKLCREDC
jgi:hypothetical protein